MELLIASIFFIVVLLLRLNRQRRIEASLRASASRLKKHNAALANLTHNEIITSGDLNSALQILTKTAAATLEVQRASIWLFNEKCTELECVCLYDLSADSYMQGSKLATAAFPLYFAALLGARHIAVEDAYNDLITAELCEQYLPQFGIAALLDAPIQFGAHLSGVVCHEHVGSKRCWAQEEINFAGSIADLAALVLEVFKRKATENALRQANDELENKVQARTLELAEANAGLVAEAAERELTAMTLRESELRLRLATKAADIGVWDWNLLDDSVVYSKEWKQQLGYAEDEIKNHYLEWETRLHPDDRGRAVAANRQYIEGDLAEYAAEFRLRHKNGSYRWIYSRGEVVEKVDGKATRVMGCHVDITALKTSEAELKVFRWFAESAGQGMGMAQSNGEQVYMNPALQHILRNLGCVIKASDNIMDYYPLELADKLRSEVLPTLQNSGQWLGELQLGNKPDKRLPTWENFFAVRNESGQPQYIAHIITDMSQQKEMERQLLMAKEAAESADRTKSMFIATMSHELRTPLNAIIGFTGILLQGLSGDLNARQRDQLGRVARSAKHLLGLITDIIDISKIEAGRIDVIPEDLILADVINSAVDSISGQAQDKGLLLAIKVPEQLHLSTDRKLLLQCIINLLSNAVKYTETGRVELSVAVGEKDLAIAVSDTGIGIEQEQLQRLFLPFERLDSFLRTRTSGTGLGLYLTRKIANDLLAGQVRVESEFGKGSRFILTVPKALRTRC